MKVSWAEMEAFQDALVAPTCGNERAAWCAFIWGKMGISGEKASPAASPARCDSSTVMAALSEEGVV